MTEEALQQPSGNQEYPGSPVRPIPPELQEVLEAHAKWLKSKGTVGKAASLSYYDFARFDLTGVSLRDVTLTGARFSGANLHHTAFRAADLRDADLSEAVNLQANQLGGADLDGAKLPEPVGKFTDLATVETGSKTTVTLFYSLLLVCVFAWLTIGATTDASLLPNTATSNLPVIGAAIPIVGFYLAGPLLLLALHVYFHLHLIRLWEGLTMLPAIFPDGRRLDQVAYPWLLNGMVCAHFPPLRRQRPTFSRIQSLLALLLAWWLAPLTLLGLWVRYLRRHDWTITLIQTLLVAPCPAFPR